MQNKPVRIVIPSRYPSTRLPGKPLITIAGVEMILRVARIAAAVCEDEPDADYVVATDDARIEAFCTDHAVPVVLTSPDCGSGTERCWDAVRGLPDRPRLIVNLQGDNPLCPPHVVRALIDAWKREPDLDVFTPCVRLDWDEYDRLLEEKKSTPYSGTTVLVDKAGRALAFSKTAIPAVRNVGKAREHMPLSPVRRHIGLYAYTFPALERYIGLEPSEYEPGWIEGLEQMRFLENGMTIKIVPVDYRGRPTTAGVDSPEDVTRVEHILAEFGELEKS